MKAVPVSRGVSNPAPAGSDLVPDWLCLERLRRGFLDGTAGRQDYWRGMQDLAQYDATFAQRIGWKWDFVLQDLQRLGWTLPPGVLVDWGCGSGIATRAVLDLFGTAGVEEVRFLDRSPLAVRFATQRLAARFPGTRSGAGWGEGPAVVLVSHVLTELEPSQVDELLAQLATATSVIWVEPGTYEASLALIAIRERLRATFRIVSPCPHAGACGILSPGNERHWCHHFASPPAGVFTDPFWGRFAHFLGIDLRSLPLSYLVLDRRAVPPASVVSPEIRVLGRPELHKADVRLIACQASCLGELTLTKRAHPELWKAARKDRFPTVLPAAEVAG